MTDDDLKSHVEDIINALKELEKDVNKEELEKELKKFMEYGVPIHQAKQTIIKKYGGSVKFDSSASSSERKLIADVESNEKSVHLLGHIIAINPKEITVKGENRQIFYGILGDESGTIQFTSWKDPEVKRGDVIEITNAYTREWGGEPQLNFGDRVSIQKTDPEKLPKSAFEPREYKVNDLKSGLGRVEVTAKVLKLEQRETQVDSEKKKVFSGILGDETGKTQFTSWHDFKIKEGDVLKITGGYIKTWKGLPQLTFDQNATVKKLDKNKISNEEIKTGLMPLHELVEKRGVLDVEIQGTIIEIKPGSGCITRCPECNRVIIKNECNNHGKVDGKPDLRIKLIVDDGTGAISSILNQELTEKILGKTLAECKKIKEEDLLNEMNNKLFSQKIKMQGNALSDNFGTTFIPKEAEIFEINLEEEADKLVEILEEMK